MAYSRCKLHMEFVDTSAIADSTVSADYLATYSNLILLKTEENVPTYALGNLNQFILDGSREIMEVTDKIPFCSSVVSGNDCLFSNIPALTIDFTNKHTSAGVTLNFVDDYPVELEITWHSLSGSKIIAKTFYPDAATYFCGLQVENYGKIIIRFIRTRLPDQKVQCRYIKYGTAIEWTGEEIQTASITEESDCTSATLPINTGSISIVDLDNDFELSNQTGKWKSIQKKQELIITEELTEKDVLSGVLYIDSWSGTGKVVTFKLIDRIGLMDKTSFMGNLYNAVPAGTIIAAIMESAGVDDYTIADEVSIIPVSGYISICSHRVALQQVLFACGAVADCTRSKSIRIRMPDRYADATIGTDRKFAGTTIKLDNYVSGVSISYNTYTKQTDSTEIYNGTLSVGNTTIEFSEPYSELAVTGGAITDFGVNYVTIHMPAEGTCILTGKAYDSKELTYTAQVEVLPAGEEKNILSFSGCTMFSPGRIKTAAEQILNYYQLRQIVTMTYLLDVEKVGDWCNIYDTSGNRVTTEIISQTIDLTGGFIAQATCRGYSKVTTEIYYAGEIMCGEVGLL